MTPRQLPSNLRNPWSRSRTPNPSPYVLNPCPQLYNFQRCQGNNFSGRVIGGTVSLRLFAGCAWNSNLFFVKMNIFGGWEQSITHLSYGIILHRGNLTLCLRIALPKDILHTNIRSPDLSYVVLMIITDDYHISEKTIMIQALITISMTIVIMMSFSRRACPPPTQGGALLH